MSFGLMCGFKESHFLFGFIETVLQELYPRCTSVRLKNLCGGEFGDGLGTFGDGVFGQFSWKNKTDSSLDFATGKGGFLVVANQFAGFGRDLVEDVVDERVHDGHTFLGHTGVWVNLFQDLVDVDRETFGAARTAFGAGGLLRGFLCWGFGHFEFDKF